MGTQTSNTVESALEILEDMMAKQPYSISKSTRLKLSKYLDIDREVKSSNLQTGTKDILSKDLNHFSRDGVKANPEEKIASTEHLLPLDDQSTKSQMLAQSPYIRPTLQNLYSSLPNLCPLPYQLKKPRKIQDYKKYNMEIYPAVKIVSQLSPIVENMIQNNKPRRNCFKNRRRLHEFNNYRTFSQSLDGRFRLISSTTPTSSDINVNNRNCLAPQELKYLELHTYDPRKNNINVLPIRLPSPLVTRNNLFNPTKSTDSAQMNVNLPKPTVCCQQAVPKQSLNLLTRYTANQAISYDNFRVPYILKTCHFSLKGCDGVTRNSKVDFC